MELLRKDTSMIQHNGSQTVYAISWDSDELSPVEKAFRIRDQNKEAGLIKIILREEEHKKHIKDGTFPKQVSLATEGYVYPPGGPGTGKKPDFNINNGAKGPAMNFPSS
jgi:hypothetical protein